MDHSNDTVSIGIDLGTSRSSLSASNGERHMVESYVGWPVDMVARKLLKKDVLFGREALDSRSMLDLRRPLERGVIKEGSEQDEDAVRELLLHLISLAGLRAKGKDRPKVRAVVGVPAEAFRVNKQRIREVLKGVTDSLAIVSEPFAVAYGMDALLHAMVIDMGAGTTDLCVMNGRFPTDEDQRTVEAAGDTIDDRLYALIKERYPEAQFSIHMVREWKEKWSFVGEPQGRIMGAVTVNGRATELDITAEMRSACESIVPPIMETMLNLLCKVEPEFQAQVRNHVILAGGSSLIRGLSQPFQRTLDEIGGGRVEVAKDPIFAASDGALAIARDATNADWERLSAQ